MPRCHNNNPNLKEAKQRANKTLSTANEYGLSNRYTGHPVSRGLGIKHNPTLSGSAPCPTTASKNRTSG